MRVVGLLLVVAGSAVFACQTPSFTCSTDEQCLQGGVQGSCQALGHCSFPDEQCPSGQRYGELAADGLANTCVDSGVVSGGTSSNTDASSSSPGPGPGSSDPPTTSTTSSTVPSTTTSDTGDTMSDPSAVSVTDSSTTDGETTSLPQTTSGPGSTSSGDDSTGDGSTTTTGPSMVTATFGEREDADHQSVTEDTFVVGDQPTINTGTHDDLHLQANCTALIEFHLRAIPSDATIVGATLELWTEVEGLIGGGSIAGYEMLENWDDGDQDYAVGVANWTERTPGVPWTTEGAQEGSHATEVLFTFSPTEPETAYEVDIPASVVQGWIDDPSSNHGIALRALDDVTGGGWVSSSELADDSRTPLLTVTWLE